MMGGNDMEKILERNCSAIQVGVAADFFNGLPAAGLGEF
jgi:hypothetical protein